MYKLSDKLSVRLEHVSAVGGVYGNEKRVRNYSCDVYLLGGRMLTIEGTVDEMNTARDNLISALEGMDSTKL